MVRLWKTDPTLSPPSPPKGYGKGEYVLPVHYTKPLELAHPHERDKHIVFHEKPHVYVVRDAPFEVSVTGIVSPFCEEFDEEEAIRKMKVSRREVWPKIKYAVGGRKWEEGGEEEKVCSNNFLCVDSSGKTIGKGSTPSEAKGMADKKRKRGEKEEEGGEDQYTLYSYERAMTDEEILDEWDRNREEAANRGTDAHYQLELWMNSLPCREEASEVRNGISFVFDQLAPIGFKPYRTEWEIFSDEEQVAGSIDLVGTAPDPAFKDALLSALPSSAPDSLKTSILSLSGYELRDACGEWMDYSIGERTSTTETVIGKAIRLIEEGWVDADRIERVNDLCGMKLVVVDWKRASSHEVHTQYDKRMKSPLHHLDDTSISKYAIQLSIYTYILEKRMGYSVLCLCLAGVHPDHPFHTWVPYLHREVDFLMTARQKRIRAKECVRSKATTLTGHQLLHRCPISKDIAWNPVREEGGGDTVYDKPYACLEFPDKTFVQDKASLLQVEEALSSSSSLDPLPTRIEGSLPWKTIMPPLGHRDWIHKDVFREL